MDESVRERCEFVPKQKKENIVALNTITVGGLEIDRLKSINISGPRCDSAFFSVAPCVLHSNFLKIAA